MGYTHYWNRPQIIQSKTFEATHEDRPQICHRSS